MSTTQVGQLAPPKRLVHISGPKNEGTLLDLLETNEQIIQLLSQAVSPSELIEIGAVYVNHNRATHPQRLVGPRDVVRVHLEPRRYKFDFSTAKEWICFENDHLIFVNKPSGLPMHATLDNRHENLLAAFDNKYFLTHRLDVPTSGLVLLAKTENYQTVFNKILMKRSIEKIYRARTLSSIDAGLYQHFMKATVKAPKELSLDIPNHTQDKWEECLLEIMSVNESSDNQGNVKLYDHKIKLMTGRTHQIRAQLSFEGAPILGDEMYGGKPWSYFGLHAEEIKFECPVTKELIQVKCSPMWS